jgi:tetratricopeptide (TPR) repeat protein
LDKQQELGPILYGQFVFRCVRGELDQAEHHAHDIRRFAETRQDAKWRQIGAACSGLICTSLGKFTAARINYENALSLGQPSVEVSINFARTLLCLGHIDQAMLWRDRALAQARKSSPFNLAYALEFASYCDWMIAGDESAQAMLSSAEEAIAISNEHGFPVWLAGGKFMRGWCLGVLGRPAESIPLILEGIAAFQIIGNKWGVPFHLMFLAETYKRAGQTEDSLNQFAEAAKVVEVTQERWLEAELHRQRGILLLSLHQHKAAEEDYRRALNIARRQDAKFWELRAATSMARLWRDQGRREEACELLAPVYGWFTEGFNTRDLKEAKYLLDELAL